MNAEVESQNVVTKRIGRWPIAALTENQCIEYILNELNSGRGGWIVTANVDIFRRLNCDRAFAELCKQASLIVADGMPLIWASRIQGLALPERIAGSSLVSTLSAGAARQNRSIFLLGGAKGTADAAAKALRLRCPGLLIAGTYCPIIGADLKGNEIEIERIAEILKHSQPEIVYVALGSPKQEVMINRLRSRLPGAWWLGVGISFSYLSGDMRSPPDWVKQTGLEWLHRLVQEPRRLCRRYLIDDLPYCLKLLLWSGLIYVRRGCRSSSRAK